MEKDEIRRAFGIRLKTLRKQRKWTQKELAAELDIGFSQFNKYECGLHIPPMEKLIQLSELFDTSLDYLLTGSRSEERPLHNMRLLERFRALESFSTYDKEAVIVIIDAMIVKNRVERALRPLEER
ncbi:MAG: helix-turn-helix transcriptional regulator [Thermodesulfobacteriota bacterium]|nr:helix-turn-helix transcriptional regulator [Thermodesulfobacteriota bacterium]